MYTSRPLSLPPASPSLGSLQKVVLFCAFEKTTHNKPLLLTTPSPSYPLSLLSLSLSLPLPPLSVSPSLPLFPSPLSCWLLVLSLLSASFLPILVTCDLSLSVSLSLSQSLSLSLFLLLSLSLPPVFIVVIQTQQGFSPYLDDSYPLSYEHGGANEGLRLQLGTRDSLPR